MVRDYKEYRLRVDPEDYRRPLPLGYEEIRALSVRDRYRLMEELWWSMWDKAPRKWFPLMPLIWDELEKRAEDGRL